MLKGRVGDTVQMARIVVDEMASCAGVGVVERRVQHNISEAYNFPLSHSLSRVIKPVCLAQER